MPTPIPTPDNLVQAAITAVHRGSSGLLDALDALPAPVYVTNADGIVTHHNKACIAFAGRTPRVGEDSWCVTWKLYTDEGKFLPHDQCPMAVSVRERRAVRGCGAVAERPDGTRIKFIAYPTPLHDDEGNFVGAVNLLLEVADPQHLRAQAARCRRLAASVSDRQATAVLTVMAAEYEERALLLEQAN